MKSIVVYYSRSGHTASIAYKLVNALYEKGESEIHELPRISTKRNWLLYLIYWLLPIRAKIRRIPLDLKNYDVVCIGTPAWHGYAAPPVWAYLKGCKHLKDKKLICFQVYGSEEGADRFMRHVEKIMYKKGNPQIIDMRIQWAKVHDTDLVDKVIQQTLAKAL